MTDDGGRTPVQRTELPVAFRPAISLRALCIALLAICLPMAIWGAASAVMHGVTGRLAGALVLATPCILAYVVLRRRIVIRDEGLQDVSAFQSTVIPWRSVRLLDQSKRSFIIRTDVGIVSAGLIAPMQRERLMRLILQEAKLMHAGGDLPWGLIARYVPRAQPIDLYPRRIQPGGLPNDSMTQGPNDPA